MLRRIDKYVDLVGDQEGESHGAGFDFDRLVAAARRQVAAVVAMALVGLTVGLAYVVTAVPLYTATTNLLIDSSKDKANLTTSIAETTYDSSAIDSQVEVLKSERIALAVIAKLKLTSDPEFMGSRGSLLGQLRSLLDVGGWFVSRKKIGPERDAELQRAAVTQLLTNLDVRRIGHTYVLGVNYTSPNSAKASVISNAFADAYITDQLDAKFDSTRRASGWLQERITELKQNSLASDFAIQKFKADHGLVTADGKLVSDQQLSELNTQIVLASGDTAKAEARYAQIQQVIKSGDVAGAVSDSLGSTVINGLREKYLAASKLEAEISARLGPGHLQAINLRREMGEYNRLIFGELERIAQTYKSDAEVARAREKSMNQSMTNLVGQNASTNETLVQLRELERESETYRTMYQNFLQRYQEALQQQSFPETEARVITAATPPDQPSYPKKSLLIALSIVLGSAAGVGIGAFREHRDRVFRTAAHVKDELGLDFLGMLSTVGSEGALKERSPARDARLIQVDSALARYAIDQPLSSFAETLRSIKVAVDLTIKDNKSKIIGVISVLPNEGKSTVSKNFASLLAHLGAKTVLIDADFRNPGLTRTVASHAEVGLVELIRQERAFRDALMFERDSGLFLIPTVVRKRLHHTSELLSSDGMRGVLEEAATIFEYVVVDLPPLGPVVDVRAAAALFDGFIFVVEWGRTVRNMVKTILDADAVIFDKCLGVVYNKVNLGKIKLYESHGSKDYYHNSYNKYYNSGKE